MPTVAVKDVGHDLHANSQSAHLRAATCAASAPHQRYHEAFYGMGVVVRIVKHHTPQKSLTSHCMRQFGLYSSSIHLRHELELGNVKSESKR